VTQGTEEDDCAGVAADATVGASSCCCLLVCCNNWILVMFFSFSSVVVLAFCLLFSGASGYKKLYFLAGGTGNIIKNKHIIKKFVFSALIIPKQNQVLNALHCSTLANRNAL